MILLDTSCRFTKNTNWWLAFVHSSVLGFWFLVPISTINLFRMSTENTVELDIEFVVGGMHYQVSRELLARFPGSFFAGLVNKDWKECTESYVKIDRDGKLFKVILDFMFYGFLPRDCSGNCPFNINELRTEADFYNLSTLVEECNIVQAKLGAFGELEAFRNVSHVIYMSQSLGNVTGWDIETQSQNQSDLVNILGSACAPFCVRGVIKPEPWLLKPIHGTSTADSLNIQELIEAATQSPFGKGTETVVDRSVRNSVEIAASELLPDIAKRLTNSIDVKALYPRAKLELRPYKLVLYQEGGHFDEHRDTVRGDNHIGTLVLILNSEHTGGELEVSHGGRTEVVTGPYSWVAMYGDCAHKINPVTSGTRVSLIYDIYNVIPNCWDPAVSVWDVKYERFGTDREEVFGNIIEESKSQTIIQQVHKELARDADLAICLQHLYPACQANVSFLKGGDQLLYDLLRDSFYLSVMPVTIHRREYNDFYSDESENHAENIVLSAMPYEVALSATYSTIRSLSLPKTKLIIPTFLRDANVLESKEINYTGNESEGSDTVYIVACLMVRKKESLNNVVG